MKKITLILVLSLLVSLSYSQAQKEYGNLHSEINIGVLSPFSGQQQVYYPYVMDAMWYPYYQDNSATPLFLKYKFHFWNFAARVSLGASYQADENTQTPNYSYESSQLMTNFKLGLQYQHQWNRIQLFYGLDMYHYGYTSNNESYYQWNDGVSPQYSSSKYEYKRMERGISPFIGMEFFISEHFSIGVESSYLIGRYNNSTRYNLDEPSKSHGFEMHKDHIALISVNAHF